VKPGDRIRVAKRPPLNWFVHGLVGVIDEVYGDLAVIDTFDLETQKLSGSGSVPLDCLEPYSDPRLESAIARREREIESCRVDCEARDRRWKDLVVKIAAEHGVSVEATDKIMQAGKDFD